MKKICIFVGSRANYSSVKPIAQKIKTDPDLKLLLFVGASAVLDKYGEVAELIKQDGFKIDEYVYMQVAGETPTTMAKSTGLGLVEIPNLLFKHQPDFTLVVGDRYEVLSMAIASAFMNIPIAHTMGGEISGTIDESIRHAITKLAHIHFPANEQARQNIIKMGENPEYVFNVGCPRIDAIKEIVDQNLDKQINDYIKKEGVGDYFEINGKFLLVSQHPVTTEFGQGEYQITETLKAVEEISSKCKIPVIWLWPNSDAGSEEIARGIRKFREQYNLPLFHFFKNLPLEIYIHLLNKTSCLIGNSSSGIREGAFLGTPVVNIGTRQNARQKGKNVINVDYNKEQIKKAIIHQLQHGKYPRENIYGDARASQRIIKILKTIKIHPQKKLYY